MGVASRRRPRPSFLRHDHEHAIEDQFVDQAGSRRVLDLIGINAMAKWAKIANCVGDSKKLSDRLGSPCVGCEADGYAAD